MKGWDASRFFYKHVNLLDTSKLDADICEQKNAAPIHHSSIHLLSIRSSIPVIYQFIHSSVIHPFIHSRYASIHPFPLFIHPSIPVIHPFIHSRYSSIHPLFIHSSIRVIHPFINSRYSSIHPFIHSRFSCIHPFPLFIHSSIPVIHPSSIHRSFIRSSIHPFIPGYALHRRAPVRQRQQEAGDRDA